MAGSRVTSRERLRYRERIRLAALFRTRQPQEALR